MVTGSEEVINAGLITMLSIINSHHSTFWKM